VPNLRCDCDYLADADTEAGLVAVARAHARDVHEIDLDDDQVLAALSRQPNRTAKE
jgi:predicted small metal-binding protein